MVGWHHRLSEHEFEQAPGVGIGQGSLVCCRLWVRKELDMTEQPDNKLKKLKSRQALGQAQHSLLPILGIELYKRGTGLQDLASILWQSLDNANINLEFPTWWEFINHLTQHDPEPEGFPSILSTDHLAFAWIIPMTEELLANNAVYSIAELLWWLAASLSEMKIKMINV